MILNPYYRAINPLVIQTQRHDKDGKKNETKK